MIRLGLLGKNISHSKSQLVYEKILNKKIEYILFDYEEESAIPELNAFFMKVDGLSITAPYKKVFLQSVEIEDELIKELGAINCIKKVHNNFKATNTDYLALVDIFEDFKKVHGEINIILLGDGAMAGIIKKVSVLHANEHLQFSRKLTENFSELNLLKNPFNNSGKVIIVNSCSRKYLFTGEINSRFLFYDLNYSSEAQENLIKSRGIEYVDGMALLMGQARHALQFWGIKP